MRRRPSSRRRPASSSSARPSRASERSISLDRSGRLSAYASADRAHAVPHVGEPRAARALARVEAFPVVDDLEHQAAFLFAEADRHARSLTRVLAGVLERLEAAEVDGGLDILGIA